MTESGEAEFSSRSEEDLHRKLDLMRRDPPSPAGELVGSVAHTLRWQSLLVFPVTGALALAGGLMAGIRVVSGFGKGQRG